MLWAVVAQTWYVLYEDTKPPGARLVLHPQLGKHADRQSRRRHAPWVRYRPLSSNSLTIVQCRRHIIIADVVYTTRKCFRFSTTK